MTLYWLSRGDESPRGPLLLSQLKLMQAQGRVAGEDMVCAEGSEDWQPVAALLGEVESVAPRTARTTPTISSKGGWLPQDLTPGEKPFSRWMAVISVIVCLPVVLYWLLAPQDHDQWTTKPRAALQSSLRDWAVTEFNDKDAALVQVGPALPWGDTELHLAQLRVKGLLHSYVIEFKSGVWKVTNWCTPGEWTTRYGTSGKAVTYADTTRVIFTEVEKPSSSAERDSASAHAPKSGT